MKKIIFCFPYKGVGGVSLVFSWVSQAIARMNLAEVSIVDYRDGFMAKNQDKTLTTLIEYDDNSEVNLPGDAIVVFQSMTPWSIYPSLRFQPTTRIFFWNCHPFNLVPTLPGVRAKMQANMWFGKLILNTVLRGYRNKMRRLVKQMSAKKALVFMDSTNLKATEKYLDLFLSEVPLVAIPARPATLIRSKDVVKISENGMRAAWIGRVVDFKFFILKHTLEQLDAIAPNFDFPISMTLVGTGDYVDQLTKIVDQLQHIDVRLIDFIDPADMDRFLTEEIDVLFAMGTSALEGAKRKIPTILLDIFYQDVPHGYPFRWLYERKGLTIGDILEEHEYLDNDLSLSERLSDILVNYEVVADKCFEHFQEKHALDEVSKKLLHRLDEAEFTYRDLSEGKFSDRGIIYSMFAYIRKKLR